MSCSNCVWVDQWAVWKVPLSFGVAYALFFALDDLDDGYQGDFFSRHVVDCDQSEAWEVLRR